jgi:hypothetical protein
VRSLSTEMNRRGQPEETAYGCAGAGVGSVGTTSKYSRAVERADDVRKLGAKMCGTRLEDSLRIFGVFRELVRFCNGS